MSGGKRYGDPRKNAAADEATSQGRKPTRELSTWFMLAAWIVFFLIWAIAGSLLAAAIVLGVMLTVGMAALKAS